MAKVLAVTIFIVMFGLIITEVWERHISTLVCGLATLVLVFMVGMHDMGAVSRTLNISGIFEKGFWIASAEGEAASSGINWATIIFIAGMMIMVEGMALSGFFRWLCMRIAKAVKYKIVPIFMTFMVLSFVLAMFIDSITVILFLAAVTVELSKLLKFNPVPMILAEVFTANLGGSATMCGDPPNIIIGTSFGYTFGDFVMNTGLIAIIALVFILIYFYLVFRKELKESEKNNTTDPSTYPDPSEAITNKKGFAISTIIFLMAVVMLITHANTGLTVAFIGVFIGAVTLIAAGRNAKEIIKKVDYKTLLFFIGLFVVVGGLEETGILNLLAGAIGKASGGNIKVMIAIIIWVSAIASAFIDNIPFAATMIPVINNLSATLGVDLSLLSWTLAMGTDIGGSATPIGASANVVGIATAAKEGHMIKWGQYCKVMFPATAIVIVISMVVIYARYL